MFVPGPSPGGWCGGGGWAQLDDSNYITVRSLGPFQNYVPSTSCTITMCEALKNAVKNILIV
jgi:hypothetical protein